MRLVCTEYGAIMGQNNKEGCFSFTDRHALFCRRRQECMVISTPRPTCVCSILPPRSCSNWGPANHARRRLSAPSQSSAVMQQVPLRRRRPTRGTSLVVAACGSRYILHGGNGTSGQPEDGTVRVSGSVLRRPAPHLATCIELHRKERMHHAWRSTSFQQRSRGSAFTLQSFIPTTPITTAGPDKPTRVSPISFRPPGLTVDSAYHTHRFPFPYYSTAIRGSR